MLAMPALVMGFLVALPSVRAQDDRPFLAAHARFAAATGPERAGLARAASDHYLALPAGDLRLQHAPAGAEATLTAERFALVVDIATEARRVGNGSPTLVHSHLTALVRQQQLAAFVDQAASDLARVRAVVQQVLATEEGALLPMIGTALRQGDTKRARWLFAELAAIEPAPGYRLGNFALCLRQLGEIEAARTVYQQARALQPLDLDLENDYGLFLRANGEPQAAVQAFLRGWQLDLARPAELRARGPAVTNLVHLAATRPDLPLPFDPLAAANVALAARPDATMLKRLVLDVALDRLTGPRKRP